MKHKTLRTLLCVILTVCFCLSAIAPVSAAGLFGGDTGAASIFDEWIRSLKDRFIEKNPGTDETPAEPMAGAGTGEFYRIVHLDCGRKYFSVENIKKLIDTMAQYGYNQLQLAFGNGGCRFLLDNMSLQDDNNYISMSSADVIQNITNGNKKFNGDTRYLTETDMNSIIAYAGTKGIEIVPMLNMPGHADAIVYGTSYSNNKNLNVNDAAARIYGYTLLNKYVEYFKSQGCRFFHFGADESGYSGTNMTTFLEGCANVITKAGMTPRAFNDATSVASMPKSVQITYWHQEKDSKSAAALGGDTVAADNKYDLINTHGRWYYVIKTAQNSEIDTKYWQGTVNTTLVSVELPILKATKMDHGTWVGLNEFFDGDPGYGSTISNNKGTMFCIWCDASEDKYLTDSDVISENENYGALYQLKKLAEHYWADDINKDPVDPVNPTVNIKVGESVSYNVTDSTVDAGDKIVGNEAYIAEAVVAKTEEVAETIVSTTKATTVEDGASYILRVYDTNYALTTNPGKTVWKESTSTLKFETYTAAEDDNVWTLEASDTGYKLNSKAGYLNLGAIVNNASVGATGKVFELVYTSTGWTIKNPSELYINALGGVEYYHSAGGWTDGSTRFDLYKVTQATDATTTLTITGAGEGTTIVTIGGIKYTINVTAPDVTETKRLTYGGSFALPTGAVVTEAPTSGVTVADGKVTAGNADAEVTVKAVTKNAGGYVTKRYIYNVTVSNVNLSGVDPLSVELWITNTWVGENGVPSAVETKTISAEDAYGENGILLSSKVPAKGYKKDGAASVRVTYWKGVVLHNGVKPVQQGADYSNAGDDFTRIRYYNNSWGYYYNNQWNALDLSTSKDTVVAYYLQINNVAPEITTGTQHYGNPPTSDPGKTSGNGYALTSFAVVYPDGTLSRTEQEMYETGMVRGYWSGTTLNLGTVFAENNSTYKISKITLTWGKNVKNSNAPNDWYTTYQSGTYGEDWGVKWNKVTNTAGDEWYDETVYWKAGDSEIPFIDGEKEKLNFTTDSTYNATNINGNNAALILIYLEAVVTKDSLQVVYWDDNADRQINETPIAIDVISPSTFTTGMKDADGNVIGGKAIWGSKDKTSTDYLPDDAYIENSVGQNQRFNKTLSTVPATIAEVYKSGVYEYVSANISEDGKTLTLHYNLKNPNRENKYVVDFGLPITIPATDFEIEDVSTIEWVSLVSNTQSAAGAVTEKQGVYGYAKIADGKEYVTYTLNQTLDKVTTIPLYVKFKGDASVQLFQAHIIPATNVYYEETFTSTNANGNWSLVGTANDVEQTCDVNVPGSTDGDVYGYDANIHDSHYNQDNSGNNTTLKALTYSNGQAYKATLTLPEGKKNVMTSTTVDFTFEGTGFDLISECGNDTGILLVTIDSRSKTNGAANVSKGYLVDTYFCGDNNNIMSNGDYLWQVPVVRDLKLPYDTYDVKVYGIVTKSSGVAVGPVAETAALAMDISDGSTSDLIADILADCGISNLSVDDVEVIYMDENSVLNGGTGTASSDIIRDKVSIQSVAEINAVTYPVVANCYVDGFRVYGALGNTETVSVDAYTNDKENEVKYMSIWDAAAKSLMTGTYYVEYKGTVSTDTVAIADYKNNGPENEIYLAQGQSIAFAIDKWGDNYKLDVSAKVVKGNPKLNGNTLVNATEMYYSVTPVQRGNIFVVYLANNTDGVLAVSGLKMSKDLNIVEGTKATEAIVEVLSRMYAGNTFNPETFNVSAPETARKNRNFTINATVTAADVAMLTIKVDDGEEEVLEPYNTMYVENGYTDDYAYSKTYRLKKAGTYTFVVTAYDATGNSVSLTRTVVVK